LQEVCSEDGNSVTTHGCCCCRFNALWLLLLLLLLPLQEVFPEDGEGCDDPRLLLSFEEFRTIMDEYDVIPIFVNPHKFAQHKQVRCSACCWAGSQFPWTSRLMLQFNSPVLTY
jgi:hypothetical protein